MEITCKMHKEYTPKCANCKFAYREYSETKEYKEGELKKLDNYIDEIVQIRNKLVEEIKVMD